MHDEQKPREPEITPDLRALERQLRGMTPVAPRIDRDRMMFTAGQAAASAEAGQDGHANYDRAGRPLVIASPSWASHRLWPVATFTMTAATLLLSAMLVWEKAPQRVVQQNVKNPTVVVTSKEPEDDSPPRAYFATARTWSVSPPQSSGYLGLRYIAVNRGINALSAESAMTNGDSGLPDGENRETKPATARGMLDELLPTHRRPNPS